jgi:hypothetical protein
MNTFYARQFSNSANKGLAMQKISRGGTKKINFLDFCPDRKNFLIFLPTDAKN